MSEAHHSIEYSVIIPVYNASQTLRELYRRLVDVFDSRHESFEIIMVDDGSSDDSWSIAQELNAQDKRVIAIQLNKNYGQHNAQMCGFRHARGRYTVTMDDDLQNPPEEIPKLARAMKDGGYDVVFAEFAQKKHQPYRNWGSRIVRWLNVKIFKPPPDLVLGNFRIIDRRVVDAVASYTMPKPYVPGLLLMSGGRFANAEVRHDERKSGRSGYTLSKIARLIFSLLFNFSDFPLRIAIFLGLFFSAIGFVISFAIVIKNFFFNTAVPGWSSLMLIISVFSSIILIVVGILGEYIVRIIDQLDGKKQYTIRDSKGTSTKEKKHA